MRYFFSAVALFIATILSAQSYYFSIREVRSANTGKTISKEYGNYEISFNRSNLSVFKNGKRQYSARWVESLGRRTRWGYQFIGDRYWHLSRNKYLDIYIHTDMITINDRGVDATVLYY